MKIIVFLFLFQTALTWKFLPLKQNKYKKKILINSDGINGFYTLGVSSFIKNNYNLDEYYFIGSSSGSWNCLLCCYKYNQTELITNLLTQDFFENVYSSNMLQEKVCNYILENYISEDFYLDKLYICISEFENSVINNFKSLEEVLEYCIISCHIPFRNKNTDTNVFDGDISKYFTISDNDNIKKEFINSTAINISIKVINELYYKGYNEAIHNKKEMDIYFCDQDILFYLDYL